MRKYALSFAVLTLVAVVGITVVIVSRMMYTEKSDAMLESDDEVTDLKSEDESEDQDDKQEIDKLDGNYGDPETCDALSNAQTYGKDEDSYMFMLPGKEDWVFRTRQDLQMGFDISEKNLGLFKKFSEILRSKGTELVIAYIPTRGMIATEYLPQDNEHTEDYDVASARGNYSALIEKMKSAKVNIVGVPETEIGVDFFNHADQHWTTKGAKVMAQAVGSYIKSMPVIAKLIQQDFKTTIGEEVQYDGQFGKFIKKACGFRPQPEKDNQVKTERINEQGELALFGDEAAPQVVLVGTSNSMRDEFNSNFDGFLKESLSTDVYNAAISGGGMDDSLLAYLGSDNFKKMPPKILIWELPGYYNVNGEGMEYALRQAISSVSGLCEKPLANFDAAIAEGKKMVLFENLEEMNIDPEQAYVAIHFDESVSKDFSISIKTSDKKNQKFKFKKRREGNTNTFFYLPKGDDTLMSSVTLNVNKNVEGLKVDARLCPLGAVVAP